MIKKLLRLSLPLILIAIILNIPLVTRQGINYEVRAFKIPLYIKAIEYIDRHYWYKRLVKEITVDCITDEEKVIAIFNWVVKNIHRVPADFDIIDDHTLNIIIRRYGTSDQMQDVFATLCVYSGFPAFCSFENPPGRAKSTTISYVLLNNRWRVFDVYNNVFFVNKRNKIASIEDVISGHFIVIGKGDREAYEDLFKNLKPINKTFVSKAEKQIPLSRIKYEIANILSPVTNFVKDKLH